MRRQGGRSRRLRRWAFPLKVQRDALADFTGTVSTSEPHACWLPTAARTARRASRPARSDRDGRGRGAGLEREDRARPLPAPARQFRWDDLDLLYFAGYALWGYVNAPFMLRRPGFGVEEAEPWHEDGETWRALRVRFPDDVPAHSREQTYYFGDRRPDAAQRLHRRGVRRRGRRRRTTAGTTRLRRVRRADPSSGDAAAAKRASRCRRAARDDRDRRRRAAPSGAQR